MFCGVSETDQCFGEGCINPHNYLAGQIEDFIDVIVKFRDCDELVILEKTQQN